MIKPKANTAPTRAKPNIFGPQTLEEELTELEQELRRRCELKMLHAEIKRDSILGVLSAQLVRIPKKIQEMNVRDFASRYGGSIAMVFEHEKKRVLATGSDDHGGTQVRKSARKNAARSKIQQIASARTMKKGEVAFSSGLTTTTTSTSVPASAVKASNTLSRSITTTTTTNTTQQHQAPPATPANSSIRPNFSITSSAVARRTPHGNLATTPSGGIATPVISVAIGSAEKRVVDLSSPNVLQMDDKDKDSALSQLEKLQMKVSSLMEALRRSGE